ncbi:MAG: acyl-CoA thioesterase, partial [Phycisphaerae bacterium]
PSGEPAIRVVMMPRDANANNTIFGGVILSYIDQAGFIEASRQAPHRYVTIAMDKVEFKKPVFVGDIVSFYAQTTRIGRTSISVHVTVKGEHRCPGQSCDPEVLTEADLTYVAIDDNHKPLPIFQK